MTPTVHAFDTESLFATLPVQEELGTADRGSAGGGPQPPSPSGSGETRSCPGAPAAARRRVSESARRPAASGRLEGAAWTFGSVHAMTRGGAHSATWHELIGARFPPRTERYSVTTSFVRPARPAPAPRPSGHTARRRRLALCFADADRLVLASQRP